MEDRKDPADDETDKLARERCHRVEAERLAPLIGRECIGEDCGAVGEDERCSDRLDEPEDDEFDGTGITGIGGQEQEDGTGREDGKPDVVEPDPAIYVR